MKYLIESKSLTDSTLEPLQLYFNIRDNALGKQWQEAFIKNVVGNDSLIPEDHPLNKLETHWGVPSHPKDIPTMCKMINHGIQIINEEIKEYPNIDIHFSPDILETEQFRNMMNEAHFHFETLIGQKWKVAHWFDNASERGKWAIMELNTNIHQIEAYIEPWGDDWMMLSMQYNCMDFLTKKHPKHNQLEELEKNKITYESYECYSIAFPWGCVTPMYAQTGKPHFDAFKDRDQIVSKENITGCRYITGEAYSHFLPIKNDPTTFINGYKKWLVENGFDLNDITQGYWPLIVADIDRQSIIPKYGTTDDEVHAEILKYHDITKVALCDDDYNIIMARDYSWYTWEHQYGVMKEMFT